MLFHEYFHGDRGAGIGASHQTGWTGVVTKLIQQSGGSRQRYSQQSRERAGEQAAEKKKSENTAVTAEAD